MTPEEHYKEVVKLDMDKFDKKMPKFDYYDLLDFADSYYKKQLTLNNVTPRYSVSLVFVNAKESLLRCLMTDAANEHEALGIALDYYKEETKGFNLSMKVVLPSYNVG